MIDDNTPAICVVEMVSSVSNSPTRLGLQAQVELVIAFEGDPEDDEEIDVSHEPDRIIAFSVMTVSDDLPTYSDLDDGCREHARLLAAELGEPDDSAILRDLRSSLREKMTNFADSIVFGVHYDGEEIVGVGAMHGFGVENFWKLRAPLNAYGEPQIFRFSSRMPLLLNQQPILNAAQVCGLPAPRLLQLCNAAGKALLERQY